MSFMTNQSPATFAPSDIDLTEPLQAGMKAMLASTNQVPAEEWDLIPADVKEKIARQFVPFLWNALPGILDQVNARIAAESAPVLNIPDTIEGLV